MKANEFIKDHGWEYAKGIIIACESGLLPKNQNYDELKRIIESWNWVELCGGIDDAKALVVVHNDSALCQAIADVESCM